VSVPVLSHVRLACHLHAGGGEGGSPLARVHHERMAPPLERQEGNLYAIGKWGRPGEYQHIYFSEDGGATIMIAVGSGRGI